MSPYFKLAMAYTREQLNEAIQASINHPAKHSRIAMILSVVPFLLQTGVSSGTGALAGLALSYVSLSPLIAGGIIGSSLPLICFVVGVCIGFCDFSSDDQDVSEEHKQILREYKNSLEHRIKIFIQSIVDIIVSFGIGVELVALGLTSPAAIGAIVTIPALVIECCLHPSIMRVIERFFPDGRK